jgi:hypothetical protein
LSTISFTSITDGSTADAADVNTPLQTIYDEFNGSIDNANIDTSAAIATSKLADDAGINTAKLADGAATDAKWRNAVAFAAYVGTNYATGTSASTMVVDTEQYDLGSNFNTSTYTFTAPYNGIYHFDAGVHIAAAGDQLTNIRLAVGGTEVRRGMQIGSGAAGGNQSFVLSADVQLSATNTVTIVVQTPTATRTLTAGANLSYFTGHMITRT